MEQLPLWPDKGKPEDQQGASKKFESPTFPPPSPNPKQFASREEYYLSPEWALKRAFALNRAEGRCERCQTKGRLEAHHLTYENLFNEKPEDLEVLCPKCHHRADLKRKREKGIRTFALNKYGDGYDGDLSEIESEYDDMIERNGGY
jgi:hypothetical protein